MAKKEDSLRHIVLDTPRKREDYNTHIDILREAGFADEHIRQLMVLPEYLITFANQFWPHIKKSHVDCSKFMIFIDIIQRAITSSENSAARITALQTNKVLRDTLLYIGPLLYAATHEKLNELEHIIFTDLNELARQVLKSTTLQLINLGFGQNDLSQIIKLHIKNALSVLHHVYTSIIPLLSLGLTPNKISLILQEPHPTALLNFYLIHEANFKNYQQLHLSVRQSKADMPVLITEVAQQAFLRQINRFKFYVQTHHACTTGQAAYILLGHLLEQHDIDVTPLLSAKRLPNQSMLFKNTSLTGPPAKRCHFMAPAK